MHPMDHTSTIGIETLEIEEYSEWDQAYSLLYIVYKHKVEEHHSK